MASFVKINDFVANAVENMDLESDQLIIARYRRNFLLRKYQCVCFFLFWNYKDLGWNKLEPYWCPN